MHEWARNGKNRSRDSAHPTHGGVELSNDCPASSATTTAINTETKINIGKRRAFTSAYEFRYSSAPEFDKNERKL